MGSSSPSASSPTTPGQPTHAPRRRRSSGSKAVTNPPGLRFQVVLPSGSRSRSTGRRLATTTKSESPKRPEFGVFESWPPRRATLSLYFRRPNTEHGQEDSALVGIVRVRGDDAPGLARRAVGQWLDIAEIARIRFGRHDTTLRDAISAAQTSVQLGLVAEHFSGQLAKR